jgi:glycosyltransferase involved in cell wall biosynthesis
MRSIVFVFRKKINGRYSIENFFTSIIPYFKKKYTVKVYFTRGWKYLLKDILYLRSLNSDIYHITGDINYFSIFLQRNKSILTIHDIGHYIFILKNIKKIIYKWLFIILPIYFSKKVVVISSFTKKKISNLLDSKKIEIIPLSLRTEIRFEKRKKINQKNIQILSIGTGWNKNLRNLIKAIRHTSWKLNIVGAISSSEQIILKNYKIQYKNFINLSLNKMSQIYKKNDILFYASLHEGFGLVILEGQASGIPLITSNIEPLRTVAGNSAYLANPNSPKDIKKGILKIINDNKYRKKLIFKGLKNIKKYHPSLIAEKYLKIYDSFF